MSDVSARSAFAPGRFRLLFLALLLLLVGSPAVAGLAGERVIEAALLVLVLVASVYDLAERRERWWSGVIASVAIGAIALGLVVRIAQLPAIKNAIVATFAGLVVFRAYATVMRPGRPIPDRIIGAICVYILIGLAWAKGYDVLEDLVPGSFRFPADTSWTAASPDRYIYLSFVTLATLGYGDIVPVTPLAGTLAWMEAITGQLYLAITVAQLVALSLVNRTRANEHAPPHRS